MSVFSKRLSGPYFPLLVTSPAPIPRRVGMPTAKTGFLGRSMRRGGREAMVVGVAVVSEVGWWMGGGSSGGE